MPLFAPTTGTVAAIPSLVSPDGNQTRQIKIDNSGRAYLTGNGVTERMMGSRDGSLTTIRTDRAANTTYQVSPDRPSFLRVTIRLTCPLGAAVSAKLHVGDDDASLAQQDEEAVDYTGLVSQVLGITPTLTFLNGRTTKLMGELSPGQVYRITTVTTGTATAAIPSVKERVY